MKFQSNSVFLTISLFFAFLTFAMCTAEICWAGKSVWIQPAAGVKISLPFPNDGIADPSEISGTTAIIKNCQKLPDTPHLFTKGIENFDYRRNIVVEVAKFLDVDDHSIVNRLILEGLRTGWGKCFAKDPNIEIMVKPFFDGVTVEIVNSGKILFSAGPTFMQAQDNTIVAHETTANISNPEEQVADASGNSTENTKAETSTSCLESPSLVDEFEANKMAAIKKYSDWTSIKIKPTIVKFESGNIEVSYLDFPCDVKQQDGKFKGFGEFMKSSQRNWMTSKVFIQCNFEVQSAPDAKEGSNEWIPVQAKLLKYDQERIVFDCKV